MNDAPDIKQGFWFIGVKKNHDVSAKSGVLNFGTCDMHFILKSVFKC